jgi:hypothetical protein
MYWRGSDPAHQDAYFSLVAILVFAWLLFAIGALNVGPVDYASLGTLSVVVVAIGLRRRSERHS